MPAGRLGWDAENEAGFIDWLRGQYGAYSASDFVPRMLLGGYLAKALAAAEQVATARGVRVQTVTCAHLAVPLAGAACSIWQVAGCAAPTWWC